MGILRRRYGTNENDMLWTYTGDKSPLNESDIDTLEKRSAIVAEDLRHPRDLDLLNRSVLVFKVWCRRACLKKEEEKSGSER
jgi:hypothetical protein